MICSVCKRKISKIYFSREYPVCEDCFNQAKAMVEYDKAKEKERQSRKELKYWYWYGIKEVFSSLYFRNMIVGIICFAVCGLSLYAIVINFDEIIHEFRDLPAGVYIIGGIPIPFFILYWALLLVCIIFLIFLMIFGIKTFFSMEKISFKK
jgi:hypothetical protein